MLFPCDTIGTHRDSRKEGSSGLSQARATRPFDLCIPDCVHLRILIFLQLDAVYSLNN